VVIAQSVTLVDDGAVLDHQQTGDALRIEKFSDRHVAFVMQDRQRIEVHRPLWQGQRLIPGPYPANRCDLLHIAVSGHLLFRGPEQDVVDLAQVLGIAGRVDVRCRGCGLGRGGQQGEHEAG
jgi:hypothetical protein